MKHTNRKARCRISNMEVAKSEFSSVDKFY